MKKLLEIDLLMDEALETARINLNAKNSSHKPIESNFIHQFLEFFNKRIQSYPTHPQIISNKELMEMDVRSSYTISKAALDQLSEDILKVPSKNYQTPYSYTKALKDGNLLSFEFNTQKINKTQLVYIYLSSKPMAFLKLPRSTQMMDALTGDSYHLREYYQTNKMGTLPAIIADDTNVSVECPFTLGIIILDKRKK